MMKCFALCTLLVTLSMCPHALAYLGDDMANTIQGCCDDGYEYASSRDASACQGSLEAPPDVPSVLLSMCTMAKAQCCREYFQKKSQCESGVEVFARTSSCDSARDIGQSCCSECSKGTASGAAQGHSGCERSPSGSSADDTLAHGAFVKCCEESAKEWQASFSRSEANDISSSKLPSTCDAYAPNELCAHHCVPVPGSYRCECNPGYVLMADGRNCKELQEPAKEWKDSSGHKEANDITLSKLPSTCEEYAPNELCAHHCIPVPGSYRCECNPGFMLMADGRNCKEVTKNRCKPRNHCQHKCNDNGLEVKCSCRRGYELMSDGKSCQDIDECQLDVLVCLAGTTCVNLQGSYRCVPNKRESSLQCPAGFTRNAHNDACDDVNECLLTTPPCPVYICENTIGGYSCGGVPGNPEHLGSSTPAAEEDRCPPGFKIGLSGECEDVDECMTGKHDCNPLSQFCINTHSSFHCQDKVSRHCPPGFKIDVNTNKCADINECEEDPGVCRPDQLCVNQLGQYDCKPRQDSSSGGSSCPNGMRKKVGSLYCEDIDECAEGLHMCDLLQNCLNTNGSYDCHCKLGYELDVTSGACVDVNECATGEHECIPQRQRCDNTVGSYLCVRIAPCGTGYVLQHSTGQCEDIDECALGTHNCGPEHTCFNIRGSFRCVRRRTTTSSTTPPPEYEYEYYDSDEETDNNTSTGNETPKDTSTSSTSTTPRPEPPTSRQTPTPQHGPTLNRRSEDNYIEPTSGDVYYSEPNNTDTSHPLLVIPKLPELPPKPEVPGPQPTEQQPRPTEPSRPTVTPPRPIEPEPRPSEPQPVPTQPPQPPAQPDVKPTEWVPYEPREYRPTEAQQPTSVIVPPEIPAEELPKVPDQRPTPPYYSQEGTNESIPPESHEPEPSYIPSAATVRPSVTPPYVVDVNVGERTATIAGERHEDGSVVVDTKDVPKNKWTEISTKPNDCPFGFEPDEYGSCFDIDECVTNRHSCSGLTEICKNTLGGYTCNCAAGFRRDLVTKACDVITTSSTTTTTTTTTLPPPTSTIKSFWGYPVNHVTQRPFRPRNLCDAGFHYNSKTYKCEDIDECTNGQANCAAVEICTNTEGGYKCECPPNWRLDDIRHRCVPSSHYGHHIPPGYGNEPVFPTLPPKVHIPSELDTKYDPEITQIEDRGSVYRCPVGYRLGEDNTCIDVNECLTGEAKCGPQQICVNLPGGYSCNCPTGHRLIRDHECEDVDECTVAGNLPVCSQNADCVNTIGSYRCNCHAGFRSAPVNDKVCVDVDECVMARAGALCQHRCNNVWGGYRCTCHRGYRLMSDNSTCVDVDECSEFKSKVPCVGRCLNEPGSYRCACPKGYKLSEDKRSCIDIDECETSEAPCAQSLASTTSNDICINTRGGYKCHRITCPIGYRLQNKHRCSKVELVCQPGDWNCTRQPTTISYNFITFVSNLYIPDTELKLFTMKGPAWSNAKMRFELMLVKVNAPPSVKKKADINDFLLTQTTNFEGLMSLVRPLEGPQNIELDMTMDVYTDEHFGGTAVAKLFIYVSEYEF